jgi:hypothetical protein
MENPPRYQKDNCGGCRFLGDYGEYDLYFCPQHGRPTVLAFYDHCEYYSGLMFVGQIPALAEAKRRAVEQGLLSEFHEPLADLSKKEKYE